MYRTVLILLLFHNFLNGHLSLELYDRLQHLIDYVENHTDSQKPDLMLGTYICEAQLKTMRRNESSPHMQLTKLFDSMKILREQYEKHLVEHSVLETGVEHNSIVVQHLLNLSFWVTSLQANNDLLSFGDLTTVQPLSITIENFAEIIDNGAPSPTESDECLAELLNSVQCTISGRCLQIMSLNNETHGYHLTHKLLYFMVVKFRNCNQCLPVNGMSLDFMIYTLCAMVQHERRLIIAMETPNQLKDLFLEQTLLCGINGYASFIDERTVREIVLWQVDDSGCFEYFDGALPTQDATAQKCKRHAVLLKGNCSDHMTGLAAATFGLAAKITNQL